jgi:hypothetical protein
MGARRLGDSFSDWTPDWRSGMPRLSEAGTFHGMARSLIK